MSPVWAREIRDAVLAVADGPCPNCPSETPHHARPALHFKQWGSYAPRGLVSGKWDVDDRTTKVLDDGWRTMYYGSNPKSGGKLLDGVEWCEFPTGAGALTPA